MPIHDAYARVTPFELTLPDTGFADDRFPLVESEAQARGMALSDPGSFPLLSEAGLILREIRGEGENPQLIHQHGALLFHCFHLWKEGRPLFLLDSGVVRHLTRSGPEEAEWAARLPAAAGYVQLPQHLLWAPGGEGVAPESVDGFFWSSPSDENLSILLVMGIRKDRPGVTVVSLPTIPLSAAAPWASLQVRAEGEDFSSSLPGGEVEGLYALEAGAEALKLAMRTFWYVDSFPERVQDREPGASGPDTPVPSSFPYRKVVLETGAGARGTEST
ncbi:hypothetical protein ACFL3S_04230 [Gemmatimonadota bacterium]